MSIATQALKYGWVALATLTIGTGTIFVAPTVLNRITLHDRIEVFMGIVERCYATQTGTNIDGSGIYAVAPPVEVRTWTDTNGASIIMTNALEWRDDLSMKNDLDVKLKSLCPYYVDTNSVYDGTTNIVMCTFTGLLTSLNLGDHTNFTSIPASGTNSATFGPWAWRNYIVAWQERYKVLNALKMTVVPYFTTNIQTRAIHAKSTRSGRFWDWAPLVEKVQECWITGVNTNTTAPYNQIVVGSGGGGYFSYYSSASGDTDYTNYLHIVEYNLDLYGANIQFFANVFIPDDLNVGGTLDVYISKSKIVEPWGGYNVTSNWNDNGIGITEPTGWQILESLPLSVSGVVTGTLWGYSDMSNHVPVVCPQPSISDVATPISGGDYMLYGTSKGYNLNVKGQGLINWQFTYATNKYW